MNSVKRHQLDKVGQYIYAHLDQELGLELLSDVACVSKYHFHRQFSAYMGISVAKYIQKLRLKRASYQLAFQPELKVIDIAFQAHFEHPESFAKAFKKAFQQSPSEFRLSPDWMQWHLNFQKVGFSMREQNPLPDIDVEIVNFDETLIAVKEHTGSPKKLNQSITAFIEWRKETGLSPVDKVRTFGVVLADPNNTPEDEFRFDISGEVFEAVPQNEFGIVTKTLKSGRCARVTHIGPHDLMDNKIYALYRNWLPESGEVLRDAPLFFEYKNFFPQVAEHELVTYIYLPIE